MRGNTHPMALDADRRTASQEPSVEGFVTLTVSRWPSMALWAGKAMLCVVLC